MVAYLKLLILILLSVLIRKGSCQKCTLDNLNVFEERSGREIGGQPEWIVTVTNNCNCTRTGIVLACKDFHTAGNVDTSLLVPTPDGRCLLKGGKPVQPKGIRGRCCAADAWHGIGAYGLGEVDAPSTVVGVVGEPSSVAGGAGGEKAVAMTAACGRVSVGIGSFVHQIFHLEYKGLGKKRLGKKQIDGIWGFGVL
ncbi:hypothetical protein Vadar_021365 [Vaccinium darrowii]|uniref:Uncharacterized protein n=1 Tax=Vaccinium darrowii TaxID=229202 RepID=A0ACB7XTH2_9ERIC|nr:hypothetical protein Vadar_021365 [Vaccinium darrowii]